MKASLPAIAWNYELRTQRWVDNNTITRTHGGDDCLWTGMLSGDLLRNSQRFIDLRSVATNAPFVMLDHQFRPPGQGFHQNSEAGKRIHELVP